MSDGCCRLWLKGDQSKVGVGRAKTLRERLVELAGGIIRLSAREPDRHEHRVRRSRQSGHARLSAGGGRWRRRGPAAARRASYSSWARWTPPAPPALRPASLPLVERRDGSSSHVRARAHSGSDETSRERPRAGAGRGAEAAAGLGPSCEGQGAK
eukprot:scaffold5494_cov28-Tisochrysis_lutea.AAC.1